MHTGAHHHPQAFPEARIDAVELSPGAASLARENIADYGLGDRITLHEGDLFAPLRGRTYDLILSNPPYVDAETMAMLPAEFRHEPAMALGSGADGLDVTRRILAEGARYLAPGAAAPAWPARRSRRPFRKRLSCGSIPRRARRRFSGCLGRTSRQRANPRAARASRLHWPAASRHPR